MRLSICLVVSLLVGCSVPNNMAGYEVSFEKDVKKSCAFETLANHMLVQDFEMNGSDASFTANNYESKLSFKVLDDKVVGYELFLDGMFSGESTGDFYQNSIAIQKQLHKDLLDKCSL